MRTDNYQGPARSFTEGDDHFELMFARALDFVDYLLLWGGGGGLEPEDIKKMSDQQSKLGLARAMAIAIEKNPIQDTEYYPQCNRLVHVGNPPATGFLARRGRRLASIDQCRPGGCMLEDTDDGSSG